MTILKKNLVANIAGMSWTALVGLVCTPFYIRFMGIEAYGLVGFCLILQSVFQIMDLGLSPTMNREMARYSVQPDKADEARDLVRTAETASWGIGISIGILLLALAPAIASHWFKAGALPIAEIRRSVGIMGLVVALQLPLGCYQGGLMGLQKQVVLNGVRVASATAAGAGAILILWKISPTPTAFFSWQIAVTVFQVALTMVLLRRNLPKGHRPARSDARLVRNVWRFAAGMSGITVTALILTQMDKVILSNMLNLKMFGYYTLAGVVSGGLYMFITPVFSAVFPRLSALVAAGDERETRLLYHRGSQAMAVLVLPIAAILSVFSFELVSLWTGSPEMARRAAPLVSLLATGTALNGLMNLPYALQLAHGVTRIGIAINSALIVLLVPATVLLARLYGAVGGAAVWLILNGIYMAVGIPITHRRLLAGETRRWMLEDVGPPLLGAVAVAFVGRLLIAGTMHRLAATASLAAVLLCAMAVAAFLAPETRSWVMNNLKAKNQPWPSKF